MLSLETNSTRHTKGRSVRVKQKWSETWVIELRFVLYASKGSLRDAVDESLFVPRRSILVRGI